MSEWHDGDLQGTKSTGSRRTDKRREDGFALGLMESFAEDDGAVLTFKHEYPDHGARELHVETLLFSVLNCFLCRRVLKFLDIFGPPIGSLSSGPHSRCIGSVTTLSKPAPQPELHYGVDLIENEHERGEC